jgi:LCP family protein required for cell wall assembly
VRYQPVPPGYTSVPARRVRRRRVSPWRLICLTGCLVPLLCVGMSLVLSLLLLPGPIDVVVLGLDARPGQGYLTRADSIMLLNVNPGSLSVTMLSIPRDVFISVPGYGPQRINTINLLGEQEAEGRGPALVKASFRESFGVDVDNYIRLDFDAFVAVVDAVGGVEIDVPKLIIDYAFPTRAGGTMEIRFEPGTQHMDGERALQYARTRHQDDDYQRAGRQQQVVEALVKKLSNPLNLYRWPLVWQAFSAHSDSDLNAFDMLRMAPVLVLGWPSREQRVLQREDLIPGAGGYAIPYYDRLNPWIAERFD